MHISGSVDLSGEISIGSSSISVSEAVAVRQMIRKMILKTSAPENMFLQSDNENIYARTDQQARDVMHVITATKAAHKVLGDLKLIFVLDLQADADIEKVESRVRLQTGMYINTYTLTKIHNGQTSLDQLWSQPDKNAVEKVSDLFLVENCHTTGAAPFMIPAKKFMEVKETSFVIYVDSENERWADLYEKLFTKCGYNVQIVIFDSFSTTTTSKKRISTAEELDDHIENLKEFKNLISIILVNTTYAFNPMKLKTNWGGLEPQNLILTICSRFPNVDKVFILDSFFKVSKSFRKLGFISL